MDTKYSINKSEVVNKMGHTSAKVFSKIGKYATLFERKNLIKDFSTKTVQEINNAVGLNMANELKWRK